MTAHSVWLEYALVKVAGFRSGRQVDIERMTRDDGVVRQV